MAGKHTMANPQPPAGELTMRLGPAAGQSFPLTGAAMTLGRAAGNDLVVANHQVSSRHASLTWDGSQWTVTDLGSANGTFVNFVQVTAPRVLQDGDVLGVGPDVQFAFRSGPPGMAPPGTAPAPEGFVPAEETFVPPTPAPAGGIPGEPELQVRAPAKKRGRRLVLILVLGVLPLCCFLVAAGATAYFLWPREQEVPTVLIRSPQHRQQVEVGQEVALEAVASDAGKVDRVELWVGDQLQEARNSDLPQGSSPFPLVAYWQPLAPGTYAVSARAFNTKEGRAQSSIEVEVVAPPDGDGDGVIDREDLCPDEPGTEEAQGCPVPADLDRDGVPDVAGDGEGDACPAEAGLPEQDGCPVPSEGDADGDGLLDSSDACPEQPNPARAEGCPDADGDGVRNARDACPAEPARARRTGCPDPDDADGDGVAGADDACPGEPGLPEHDGCPAPGEGDVDGDGLLDGFDACPEEPGPPQAAGCPDADRDGVLDPEDACPTVPDRTGILGCPVPGDLDRDGIADPDDVCPAEPGLSGQDGCPAPSEGDGDGDGLLDALDRCPAAAGPAHAGGCPDADGDGVPDDLDACPAEPDRSSRSGCPAPADLDGDGLIDTQDACPAEPGLPEQDGCPAPSEGDADGDGLLDGFDDCPQEPGPARAVGCPDGDGDGVRDSEDACPAEPGRADLEGCPAPADLDGDGIADAEDACPTETGLPGSGGCPAPSEGDADGDGLLDGFDRCPEEPGPAVTKGCPDADGDGVADSEDACPDEPDRARRSGCPAPEDLDGDGIADAEDACPGEPGLAEPEGCPVPSEGDADGDGLRDAFDRCPAEPGPARAEGCPDADGDGARDGRDACPAEPARARRSGCPADDDGDGDGVADPGDACPGEPGLPDDGGCPAPREGDADGDGLLDGEGDAGSTDACPDEPGLPQAGGCPDADRDGVPDSDDACPAEPDWTGVLGCPLPADRDGDGVPDAEDACPDVGGLAEGDGCPDRDADGVPDDQDPSLDQPDGGEAEDRDGDGLTGEQDLCPDEPGPAENAGCPPPGPGEDADGDGVPDEVDNCREAAGRAEHGGCPPPDPDVDADGDGINDQDEQAGPGLPGLGDVVIPEYAMVEFRALDFHVDRVYEELTCYARLGQLAARQHELQRLPGTYWEIPPDLGTVVVPVPEGEALTVWVYCFDPTAVPLPGQAFSLGSLENEHAPEEWAEEQEILGESAGGEDGRRFWLRYRLCPNYCAASVHPPPIVQLVHDLGPTLAVWYWNGDQDLLDGYWLYVDRDPAAFLPAGEQFVQVDDWEPGCEGQRVFQVTAYSGPPLHPELESPLSNLAIWEGEPCARHVRVTFERLTTRDLEWLRDGDEQATIAGAIGPIIGHLYASGSGEGTLFFDAAENLEGYYVYPNQSYLFQELFEWIHGQPDWGQNGASAAPYVTVGLGPNEDLTVGADILDVDEGRMQTILQASVTLPAGEIAPDIHTIVYPATRATLQFQVEVVEDRE